MASQQDSSPVTIPLVYHPEVSAVYCYEAARGFYLARWNDRRLEPLGPSEESAILEDVLRHVNAIQDSYGASHLGMAAVLHGINEHLGVARRIREETNRDALAAVERRWANA